MTHLKDIHREAWFWIAGVAIVGVFLMTFMVWPFAPMSSLAIAAAIIRGALLTLTGFAVLAIHLPYWQRVGLAGATVGMFMTTQSLLNPHTPWEAWASIISGAGWLCFMTALFGQTMWEKIGKR